MAGMFDDIVSSDAPPQGGNVFSDIVETPPPPKGLLSTVGDSFKGAGARMAQGVNESLGSINHAFGMNEGAKMYQENADYWKQKAEEAGSTGLAAKIYTGIGEAPAGVAEFMGNVPYAAAKGAVEGYREDGLTGAVSKGAMEGVKRLGVGKVFHGIENTGISGMSKAAAMGGTMGAQTAAEQYGATGTINPEDVAASTATGAFLSLDGGGKSAEVKRNLLNEGVQSDIAQDLSSRTPMTLATARERLQKSKVEIPDTGITDDSVSVDQAIASANAAVDWTHDERNRLLKELGGEVEEPDTPSLDAGTGGEAVSTRFLDPAMIKAVEQRRGAPLKGELTPEELQRVQATAAPEPVADIPQPALAEAGPPIEPAPPEAAGTVPEIERLALPAPEEVKQLPYRGEAAKVPETKEISDSQISPVAGLSEPVDTQVSPENVEVTAKAPDLPAVETVPPDVVNVAPLPKAEAPAPVKVDNTEQEAIAAMREGRVYLSRDGKTFMLSDEGGGGYKPSGKLTKAPWDKSIRAKYPDFKSLYDAAKEPAPVGEKVAPAAKEIAPPSDTTSATRNVLQQLTSPKRKSDTLVSNLKDAHGKDILNQLAKQEMIRFPGQGRAEVTKAGAKWLEENPAPRTAKQQERYNILSRKKNLTDKDRATLAELARLPEAVKEPAKVEAPAQPQFSVAKDKTDTPEFKRWFGDSKVVDKDGRPLVLYHQTTAENKDSIMGTGFDVNRVAARGSDEQMPDGIFMKPSDGDIGLRGKEQIPLFVKMEKPFFVRGRDSLDSFLRMSEDYFHWSRETQFRDKELGREFDALEKVPKQGEGRRRDNFDELQAFIDNWEKINADNAAKSRKAATDFLRQEGFDGVIVEQDAGAWGRKTKTYIAFEPTQVKSAVENIGTFDPNNPNIRYSVGNSEATITPEVLSKVTDVLVKALPDKVDLRVVPSIDYTGPGMDEAFAQHGVKSGKVEGLHQAVLTNGELRSIITLSMDGATERTGYHETLHAAESLRLIKSKDLAILERAYPTKDGVDSSERRADAFADYVSKKEQPANSLIRAMFDRIISFANRLKAALNGEGWRTAGDVFKDLMGGKLKDNAENARPSGPQFAVAGDIPEETKGEKFWRTVQDRYNRVEVLQNFLKEKGVQLSELADVSRGLSVMNGKIADQLKRFLDNKIAPLVKEAGSNKIRLPDIEDFLLMQHAQEANAAMRKLHKDPDATAFGVTDSEAQAKLAAYQARPDYAQLERTANKFRAFSDETANMLQSAGIISPEMKQAWDNAYQHYVPVRGGEDNTGTGKGVRVNGKQQRRSGHDRRQEHVIENIVKAREFAVKAIEKNKVALSVAQLIREAGDDRIGTVGKPEKRRVFSQQKNFTVEYQGNPVASFTKETDADAYTNQQIRQGAGKLSDYQVRISSDPTVSWATSPTLGDNEINAFVNGHQVRIQINDEIAARALTNGGIEQLATLFKAGKSINNYLSRAYTGYDPRFTIRNTARDFTAGMVNLTGDYGAKTAAKIALNYPVAMKEFIKGRENPANSQWVDRYRKAGGSTGASWLPSIERLGEDIQSMYHEQIGAIATYQKVYQDQIDAGASPMNAGIKAATQSGIAGFHKVPIIGHFLKMVEMMNAVSENAFRVATFKTLVEEGKSEGEAGEAAKSSTINFDKKGEWGAQIGALYLFFNPAVQGVRRTGKALFQSEHKFQAQAMAGSMALAGYMAAEAARSMWSDDEWDKIPRSVKNRNLVVRTGEKTQITIPIPYEYGTFVGVGYAVNDMVHGKADKRTGLNLAGTLMDAMSVIGNPVTDKGDIQPLQMMPTLAKLILAPTMNLNNFGGEIQPSKRDSSPKPDSQNMYRNTKGSYYEKAAAKMNELTGGTKYSSGAVDVSPEVLKFYTRSILGGSFTFLDQVLGLGTMTAQGVKPDVGEVPMVNVLARENTVRDTRTAFYEIANDANKALAEYNAAKKGKAFDVAKDLKEQNADLIAVAHIAKTQAKLAKAKRDAADAIRLDEDMPLSEKRERMKALEAKEEVIYNRLISKFNKQD